MIAIVILTFLCLAAASVVMRVVLFFMDRSDQGRLARIAAVAGAIGFLPLRIVEWACNLAMLGVFLFMLAYWIAPQQVHDTLDELIGPPPAKEGTSTSHRR